jgi:hypothetical protein
VEDLCGGIVEDTAFAEDDLEFGEREEVVRRV